jgi:hypothetical protein
MNLAIRPVVVATVLAAICVVTPTTVSAEELRAGLEPGARVGAFTVKDVTGPAKGEELCYRCRYGSQPVVSIFAKNVDDNVAKLTKELDKVVAEHREEKMAGFLVALTDDQDAMAPRLEKVAEKHEIKQIPLTTFDGVKGPKGYKLNEAADVTVMMWVEGKLAASHAFKAADLNASAIEKVVANTKTILE